jgi:hypothetical protein
MTNGGDGLVNYKTSDETKLKISQANKGKISWNKGLTGFQKGKKLSEETKRKISDANKFKKHTDETKNKISKSKKNIICEKNHKQIIQYDINNNIIKEYKSLTQCSNELNIDAKLISAVALGKRKTTNKFKFKYK